MDPMCDSLYSVASGISQWLHDGWSHSCLTGHRHRCSTDPSHSRTKTIVAIWTLAGEGEVFGKEGVDDDVVNPNRVTPNFATEGEDEKINDCFNGFVCF
jgi:hypothetical protein